MQNDMLKNQETKQERFIRVATRRTNDILNRIRTLGNCANKSAYAYTDEDIQKIFGTIERELRFTKAKFGERRRQNFVL